MKTKAVLKMDNSTFASACLQAMPNSISPEVIKQLADKGLGISDSSLRAWRILEAVMFSLEARTGQMVMADQLKEAIYHLSESESVASDISEDKLKAFSDGSLATETTNMFDVLSLEELFSVGVFEIEDHSEKPESVLWNPKTNEMHALGFMDV